MSKPEPLDIDADPRNADWLHRLRDQRKPADEEKQQPEEQPAESDDNADDK